MKKITQLFDLAGKGAVVTAGESNFGKAIAMRLGEAGACVNIADINPEAAEQAAGENKAS